MVSFDLELLSLFWCQVVLGGGFGGGISGGFGVVARGGFGCRSRSGGLGGGVGSCGMVLPSEIIIDEFCRKSEHLYCESLFAPV